MIRTELSYSHCLYSVVLLQLILENLTQFSCLYCLYYIVLLQPIMESGAVELLVGLTGRDDPALRLNGIWALMVRH